jgi:thiosulfate dehydrogenase
MKGALVSTIFVVPLALTLAWTGYAVVTMADYMKTRLPYDVVTKAQKKAEVHAATSPTLSTVAFAPPAESDIPDSEFGKVVRQGREIFIHTDTAVPQFVGDRLQCASCHLEAGRSANSAPMWGAYGLYPAFRKKNNHVNTFSERLQECFRYSMNGVSPPAGDPTLVALESYAYWMSKGAPTGEKIKGQGFLKLAKPGQLPDFARGSAVYAQRCALCHGADGAGNSEGAAVPGPPLWGRHSYNWGAGMQQIPNAAGFIKANMPLGQGYSLSDQDAWDLAMFVDSHERPQDPRFKGSIAETQKQFHDDGDSMYGQTVDGKVLGSQSSPAGKATVTKLD